MKLPENLLPDDVVDAALWTGFAVDRRNVTRALQQTPIPGVVPSPRRGIPWQIPRSALVDVLAACLQRRAMRELAPQGLRPKPLDEYRVKAARAMLEVDGLARLVPAKLKKEVWRRDEIELARRRLRQQQAEEERRRLADAANARWRRERELEEQRLAAFWERERQRKLDRALDRAYGNCKRCAYEDAGRPRGPRWPEETPHWKEDWPTSRPSWWAPPPGMLEVVQAQPECIPYGYQEPDWRQWVPPYVPGRPWPWRVERDADSDQSG